MSIAIIVLFALLLLALLLLLGADDPDAADDESPDDENRRGTNVTRQIGALNYGTVEAVEQAKRELLSVGPRIVPQLLEHIARLDSNPRALTGDTQVRVEQVAGDFSLGGYLALRGDLAQIAPDSVTRLSIRRVMERIGVPVLEQAVREPESVARRYFDPAVADLLDAALDYLPAHLATFPPEQRQVFAHATAIALGARASVPLESLPIEVVDELRALSSPHAGGVRTRWGPDGAVGLSASGLTAGEAAAEFIDLRVVLGLQSPSDREAVELGWSADGEPEDDGGRRWLRWAWDHTDDARVREAVLSLAAGDSPAFALALARAAADDPGTASEGLRRRLRSAWPRGVHPDWGCVVARRIGSSAVRMLVEGVCGAPTESARLCARSIGELDSEAMAPTLFAAVGRQGRDGCPVAVDFIGARSALWSGRLVASLGAEDADVRRGAIALCGRFRVAEAVAPLLQCVQRPSDRLAALRSLEEIGAVAAAPMHNLGAELTTSVTADPDFVRCRRVVTLLAERRPGAR